MATISTTLASEKERLIKQGFRDMGFATPDQDPGLPSSKVFYLATELGTYEKFGNVVVESGDTVLLIYDTSLEGIYDPVWGKISVGVPKNGGGGSTVELITYYTDGTRVATLTIDGDRKDIFVPKSSGSGLIGEEFFEATPAIRGVSLKSKYEYLNVNSGLYFSGYGTGADFEVQVVNIDSVPTRVLHSRLPIYSDSFVSAGGLSPTGGSAGITDLGMWKLLTNNPNLTSYDQNTKIATAHIPDVFQPKFNFTISGTSGAVYDLSIIDSNAANGASAYSTLSNGLYLAGTRVKNSASLDTLLGVSAISYGLSSDNNDVTRIEWVADAGGLGVGAWHIKGNLYADGWISAGGLSNTPGQSAGNASYTKIDGNGGTITNGTDSVDVFSRTYITNALATAGRIQSVIKGTATSGGAVTTSNGIVTIQFPDTLPASDVYAWAKEATKPSYSFSEITGSVSATQLPSLYIGTTAVQSTSQSQNLSGIGNVLMGNNKAVYMNDADGTGRQIMIVSSGNTLQIGYGMNPLSVGGGTVLYGKTLTVYTGADRTNALSISAGQTATFAGNIRLGNGQNISFLDNPSSGTASYRNVLDVSSNNGIRLGYGIRTTDYYTNIYGGNGIYFGTAISGANAMRFVMVGNNFYPYTTEVSNLGLASKYWDNAYIKTVYENGTALSSKYLALAGGTMTGAITPANAQASTAWTCSTLTTAGDITINSPDWTDSYGLHINEGGSSIYGFDIMYGSGDMFSLGTRNGSSTPTTVFEAYRGSTDVGFKGNVSMAGVLSINPAAISGVQDGIILHDSNVGGGEGLRIKWTAASYTTGVSLSPNGDHSGLECSGSLRASTFLRAETGVYIGAGHSAPLNSPGWYRVWQSDSGGEGTVILNICHNYYYSYSDAMIIAISYDYVNATITQIAGSAYAAVEISKIRFSGSGTTRYIDIYYNTSNYNGVNVSTIGRGYSQAPTLVTDSVSNETVWDVLDNSFGTTGNIVAYGNVGIKTTNPSYPLDVAGVIHASTGIWTDGYFSGGGLASSSDRRLKKNIKNFGYTPELLLAIRPREWDWKDGSAMVGHAAGFVAQEIEPIMPYAVDGTRNFKALFYDRFHALEISALQDHERRIKALEDENEKIRRENIELKRRLNMN